MQKRHLFRPTTLDALEDRTVPSHVLVPSLSAAVPTARVSSGTHHTKAPDLTAVDNQINQAFASFAGDVQRAIAVTDFTPPQTFYGYPPYYLPVPVTTSNQSLPTLRLAIQQRASLLSQQIGAILAPLPGAANGLLPEVQSQISGLNGASLNSGLSTGLGNSLYYGSTIPVAHSYSVLAANLTAATDLATLSQVSLNAASPPGARHHVKPPSLALSLQLAQIPPLISQAFTTLQGEFQSAFTSEGIGQFDQVFQTTVPPPSVLANFKAATLQEVDLLSVHLNAILAPIPGAKPLGLASLVQAQVDGPAPGSLRQALGSTLDAIKTAPNTNPYNPYGANPSTSNDAFNNAGTLFGTVQGNILADLDLAEMAILRGGTGR